LPKLGPGGKFSFMQFSISALGARSSFLLLPSE
jgi:hypothetical protein